MITAAGIMALTTDNLVLFLKRGNGSDHPGEWCFPGGQQEEGEAIEACAIRECLEESGKEFVPEDLSLHTHSVAPAEPLLPEGITAPSEPVDFTTYLTKVEAPFPVTICDESSGFAWASLEFPPEPLHPGCRIALARLSMNELDVARAMSEGSLSSPQIYKNVHLWNIRITGTGVSYRASIDEYVHRNPADYLNPEFLARCNGLATIWYHPKRATLDSEEFTQRIVGSVFLPYIKGEEVWAIAKVYDDEANASLIADPASTSPCVVLPEEGNFKLRTEDGRKILIETSPELLDHIALLPKGTLGVWDKGEGPTGVDRSGIADSLETSAEAFDQILNRFADSLNILGIRLESRNLERKLNIMENQSG